MTGLGTPVANLLVPDLVAYHGQTTTERNVTITDGTGNGDMGSSGDNGPINAFRLFDAEVVAAPGAFPSAAPAPFVAQTAPGHATMLNSSIAPVAGANVVPDNAPTIVQNRGDVCAAPAVGTAPLGVRIATTGEPRVALPTVAAVALNIEPADPHAQPLPPALPATWTETPAWLAGAGGYAAVIGNDPDVLIGGDGHDLLIGGAGGDLLVGGTGRAQVPVKAGDDVLVAGYAVPLIAVRDAPAGDWRGVVSLDWLSIDGSQANGEFE